MKAIGDDSDEYIFAKVEPEEPKPRVPTQEELNEKYGWNR